MDDNKIPYIAFEADTMTTVATAEGATEWAGLPHEMRLKCHADSVK